MQPRHWHSLVFAAVISLVGVAAVLSLPASAQAPHSLPSTSNTRIANTLVGCVAMINGGFETGSFARAAGLTHAALQGAGDGGI